MVKTEKGGGTPVDCCALMHIMVALIRALRLTNFRVNTLPKLLISSIKKGDNFMPNERPDAVIRLL